MKSTYIYVYTVNIVRENKPELEVQRKISSLNSSLRNVTAYTYPGYSDNK